MEYRQLGVSVALGDYIHELRGREFTSRDAIDALPQFRPDAIRTRLNWLVTHEELKTRRKSGKVLVYRQASACAPEQGGHFSVSNALLSAMGRLAKPRRLRHRRAGPVSPSSNPDLTHAQCADWVRSLLAA